MIYHLDKFVNAAYKVRRKQEEMRRMEDNKGEDNQPRYTTKRMHHEIARAKMYAMMEERERCAKLARDYAVQYEAGLCHYGAADKDSGRGRQEGHIMAGHDIAAAIMNEPTP